MITERALVFEKIRIRFCRNLIMYSVPESPDIIEAINEIMDVSAWDKILQHRLRLLKTKAGAKDSDLRSDQLVDECKKVIREGTIQNKSRSIVGIFSSFDELSLERLVGTLNYKNLLTTQTKDHFTF